MTESRRHAITSSELLSNTESFVSRLENLSPEERLEMAATGGFGRANADLRFTVELAVAHALASLALSLSEHWEDTE